MLKHGFCVFALLGFVGCGSDGPDLAEVTGTVTIDGKPVHGAMLTFVPEAAGGSPSYGVTDAEGNYSLMFTQDKNGAMLGKHNVEIETRRLTKDDMAEGVAPPEFVPVPKKYKQTGALTAEVKDEDNDIDFALESK